MIIRLNSILKSNTKKPRQCKCISEACFLAQKKTIVQEGERNDGCFLAQKKTIVQEGERNDGPPPATIATSEGGVTYFGEICNASCTLGSNEIH